MANTITQAPAEALYFGASSVSKQYGSNCTSGSLLVCAITGDTGGTITDVEDDVNGNWTQNAAIADGSGDRAEIWSFPNNASTGKPTVSVTFSANGAGYLQIYEITGGPTSSVVDVSGTQNDNGAPSIGLNCLANSTLIAVISQGSALTGADTGFTLDRASQALDNCFHAIESKADSGAAGTTTMTFNGSGAPSSRQAFAAVAYKTTAVAATAQPTMVSPPQRPRHSPWISY